jgi:hypothetical protein
MAGPFPLGLRFSGKNMSPLPCWLAGAQNVALNMTNNDLAVHLHFALFDTASEGYVLKPVEMRGSQSDSSVSSRMSISSNEDAYWPPPRMGLHRTTIDIICLHNLPKVPARGTPQHMRGAPPHSMPHPPLRAPR